jgi:hypothetical protein
VGIGFGLPPRLVSNDGSDRVVMGDIFHTADASPFDSINRLNPDDRVQSLSRLDGADALLVAFEDLRLIEGDADFNDLVVRVVATDGLLGPA